ncbi:LysR family transcriptional regulator [Paeniglutamicibacter sp. MACA_103]|uniref:LysR family transcriptional regulator n=1 Tax=Paeniglutamicibacter sp. MACA_103 TaxID=3377337 RepID=UPI0038960FB4
MAEGPTLRQLQYFLRAVETGSFSAAAEAEYVAQPSISEQIRRLERLVGAQLFTRTNRQLQLTDVGRLILPLAKQTLASAENLTVAARDARTLSGGEVSFGTFNSAHSYMLTPLISEFKSLHPQVRIRLLGLNSAQVADSIRNGDLEAGLVQLPIDDTNLHVSEPVLVDEAVFASADPQRTLKPVTIEFLAESKLILSEAHWRSSDPLRRGLHRLAAEAGVQITPDIEVEFQSAALELAANGLGDTVASYYSVMQYSTRSVLSWARLDPPYKEVFAFVTRASGGMSPATARFIELARKHISGLATLSGP